MRTVDLAGALWRKSSRSSGEGGGNSNCVEIAYLPADWRKSSYSGGDGGGNDNCVEVAFSGELTAVRDSKNAGGAVLAFPAQSWAALLTATADDATR
jgi:hypothetical protein